MKKFAIAAAALALLALGVESASAASPAYCDRYARDYANANSNKGGQIVGGAVTGAIGGALLGGIFGGGHNRVANGAAIGAGVGALSGAASNSPYWNQLYEDAYYQCINSPGPRPAPVYDPGYDLPPVGSRAWKQMCAQKYRSFDWQSGYFVGYDGEYHMCTLP
jgi:uncharacterized protein YcfJ